MTAKQQPAPAACRNLAAWPGWRRNRAHRCKAPPLAGVDKARSGWVCCLASPDREAALQWARTQVRHDGSSAVTRVEVRAISDTGVTVCWE